MKVTYIKLFNRNNEKVLMKHLRKSENPVSMIERITDYIGTKRKRIRKLEDSKKAEQKYGDLKKSVVEKIKSLKVNSEKNGFVNQIVKKNQVVLVALSLMLVTAGYLNYTNNIKMAELGDAQLVSANVGGYEVMDKEQNELEEVIETPIINEENMLGVEYENVSEKQSEVIDEQEETVKTSSNTDSEYFTKTKLEREKMYSQMIETYQKILENESIPNDQKAIASNEIRNINNRKTAIATVENLLKTKGFEDVVILANDDSVNIVVKSNDNLESKQVAQIQNIISRELQVDIEEIHITTYN